MDIKGLLGQAFRIISSPAIKPVVDAGLSGMGEQAAAYVRLALTGGQVATELLNAFTSKTEPTTADIEELKARWDAQVNEGAVLDAATAVEANKRPDRADGQQ